MSIIMGGSGSTGSSLVKNILNRHPDIFAGGETSLFAKKGVYDNWDSAKRRITLRRMKGLRNFGFHLYNGTDLAESEYLKNENEVQIMADESESFSEFCELYYEEPLSNNGAKVWLEKTPANAACFKLFLDYFEEGKVIHMVRNPFDTIASLWARGYNLYYAVGIYLLNTSSALSARGTRYHEIKYESLIDKPSETIELVCNFLGIAFSEDMLYSQNEKIEVSQLSSWKYDETANIGSKAVGRFEKLEERKKMQIIEAVNTIEVSTAGKKYYNLSINNVEELCDMCGYDFHGRTVCDSYRILKGSQRMDRLNRIKRGYKTGVYYPLSLKR